MGLAGAGPAGVSVVIPAYNEAESLRELIPAVCAVLEGTGRDFEIVVIDDGSVDATEEVLTGLCARDPRVRALVLRRNFGKSAALATGFAECRGAFVVTMDADLQDDPEEIPAFLQDLEGGLDLVSGWKRKRRDPLNKTLPSRFFNRVTAWATGIRLHDFNCGFKGYRRDVCRELTLYGEMHRFIPVLAHREGFRVGEREVRHHPRRYGRSKFGPSRFVNGFLDLLEVTFLAGGRRTPLHVFGRWGTALLTVGLGLNVYMLALWIAEGRLRVRPLLLFGVILVILGVQFISIGLLAALLHAPRERRDGYPVRRRLPADAPAARAEDRPARERRGDGPRAQA
jgi:glycosyltransferase involved in cell wall biosynthesis